MHLESGHPRELTDAANAEGCCVLSLPRVFEERWTEFTSSLIKVVLRSWHALVAYFKNRDEKEAAATTTIGLHATTLIDMDRYTSKVKVKVLGLKETALLGGWVEALSEQVLEEEDGTMSLKGVKLNSGNARRRHIHHLYVTDTRNIDAIKNEIIESLKEFLTQR
ncbi:Hypothetical predicted protein [Paramuricea clavata]|uniref:Uncharacterized protein n=1 Tax=Paramuricea clavata TaxID=317549 RepID=A0A6S7JVT9_PARCT|nr:Hypothetical predicted protein [Paramuricea clavata]CAB4033360.1 Hypothetical predicted protein [Paramuricea clavata]